jgi:signal transduction histidine kinase/DNA-binding NarL/FixJ family response regulator
MKQLLEKSKQQLLNPLRDARRKLLIILNVVYCILAPFFLISEKLATGNFVNDSVLYFIYGIAIGFNLLSAIYNILILKNTDKAFAGNIRKGFIYRKQEKLDLFFGYASAIPILFMSFCNMMGLGNPSNDSILTDFALAQSLMIVVVIILGRKAAVVWFIIVVTVLFWNVSKRGWDYEYHYMAPSEVVRYKDALKKNEPWALQRKAEVEKAGLNPPRITRYFNTWIVFIIVTFLVAYFFSGITIDIFRIVPAVVKNIEQATEESKQMELEQKANEEKTNTFINLAHETKTPLTLINNYLEEYIKKHGENEEIEVIKGNVQRLTTDIVNFFDIERFNKGISFYDHTQVTDFSEILLNKISLFECYAKNKHIDVHEKIEPNCLLMANPGAIDRVINNLIENAIKFTPENGRILVSLHNNGDRLIFSVSDTGTGIPSKYHSRVFEPYFQLGINKKSNEGMGMGLSIVKKIVDEVKGEITLQSELNQGTKISVIFSAYSIDDGVHPALYDISRNVNLSINSEQVTGDRISDQAKPYILVVEDNIKMLNYLVETLQDKYNVYAATGGGEALEKLNSIKELDLIISDVMMDTMDGFEFCKTLSINKKYSHIPFIFLTAKTTDLDKIKGLQLGAIDYIEKPFVASHLISKIESVLGNLTKQHSAIISQAYKLILSDRNREQSPEIKSPGHFLDRNARKYGITPREVEIIYLIIKGLPYKVIGHTLNISEKTVAKHVSNIFMKVSVTNKVELINKLEEREDLIA